MIIKVGFRGTASGHKFIYITLPRSYDCLFHAVIWLQIPHIPVVYPISIHTYIANPVFIITPPSIFIFSTRCLPLNVTFMQLNQIPSIAINGLNETYCL